MVVATVLFSISAFLAGAGNIIVLGSVAALQQSCNSASGNAVAANLGGGEVSCSAYMSLYWVSWVLQLLFLVCVAVAAATQSIHTYKSTLAAQGAVVVALGMTQCSSIYMYLMGVPHSSPSHNRAWAYLVGQAIALCGTLLMLFTGDAMYRENRIDGRDGFVTFRRGQANGQANKGGEQEASAAAGGNSGPAGWAFVASLSLSAAGAFIVLGGIGSLQNSCNAGTGLQGAEDGTYSCQAELSLPWTVWILELLLLSAISVAFFTKQIHAFRSSLWALAAAITSVSCYLAYQWFYLTETNAPGAQPRSSIQATLAGFCIMSAGNLLLMLVGDYVYRLKHVQGADGFVSMRRPGSSADGASGTPITLDLKRPVDWAFLTSVVLAFSGTMIALGGLGSAQSSCSSDSLSYQDAGARCSVWMSFSWWALALQMVVLACTLAAWATSYVHSFKNSLWGMAAVVAFVCIECCNQIYFSWQWSTGTTHRGLVVALYGLAILISGNYLMMGTGDALHQLKREEGADGFVTFRQSNCPAPPAAYSKSADSKV